MLTFRLFFSLFCVLKLAGLTAVRGFLPDPDKDFDLSEFRLINWFRACRLAAQLKILAEGML